VNSNKLYRQHQGRHNAPSQACKLTFDLLTLYIRPVATFRHEEAVSSSFLVDALINVLTLYLLTYISSTIGCANLGPDWPLLFKVYEI